LHTKKIKGLHENHFIMAAKIDRLTPLLAGFKVALRGEPWLFSAMPGLWRVRRPLGAEDP
jgi:hypothetical protein